MIETPLPPTNSLCLFSIPLFSFDVVQSVCILTSVRAVATRPSPFLFLVVYWRQKQQHQPQPLPPHHPTDLVLSWRTKSLIGLSVERTNVSSLSVWLIEK